MLEFVDSDLYFVQDKNNFINPLLQVGSLSGSGSGSVEKRTGSGSGGPKITGSGSSSLHLRSGADVRPAAGQEDPGGLRQGDHSAALVTEHRHTGRFVLGVAVRSLSSVDRHSHLDLNYLRP